MGWDIVTGPDAGAWTAAQIGTAFLPSAETCIGLTRHGEFVAGVIYEDWNGKSIVAHIAITRCITPAYLAAIFDYPFNVCGAHKIICPVCSDNPRAIKLVSNMGFAIEAALKDAAPTGDILIFTLTKADCRFLKEHHGKEKASAAACA